MHQDILKQLQELYEKQDILARLTTNGLFSGLGFSEVHCLSVIEALEEPNATQIASAMQVTRGAVSKIIKKLADKHVIEVFQKPVNKKEKYIQLTPLGAEIEQAHQKAHHAWQQRDTQFLQSIQADEQAVVSSFLTRFNHYLEQLIKENTP